MEPQQSDSLGVTPRTDRPLALERRRVRGWAGFGLLVCLVVLGLAAYLTPDPRGYGTHCQLGFGKCGMLVTTGFPCPTCGMTTAFAYTVRGQWIRAFLAQPTGFVLALATVAGAALAGWSVVTGRVPRIRVPVLTPHQLFLILLVLLIGGWGFKIVLGLMTGSLPERP